MNSLPNMQLPILAQKKLFTCVYLHGEVRLPLIKHTHKVKREKENNYQSKHQYNGKHAEIIN